MSASQDNKVDYKQSVHLPVTDFPMKGNLPTKEPELIQAWNKNQLYQKLMAKNKGKTKFTLPDGPPYANGSIHIGHALNKILKDIVIKYKNMQGYWAPFIPGWDCHGLPIEHAVLKNLGPKAKEKTDAEIRALCRAEAMKWIEHQKPQFIRLGILADWENPYYTLQPQYEAEQIREFGKMYEKGLIYIGTKPVYWNWTLQTALADAEVEYHMHRSPAIYVKFEVQDPATLKKLGVGKEGPSTSFVIWTTTPWTLPANLGICLNEEFEYGVFEIDRDGKRENIVIAKNLREFFEKDTGLSLHGPQNSFKGGELDRGVAKHPFINRNSLVMLGSHVTADAGTGCVHTAPGHGMDDYKVGIKYGLEVLSPVDERGCYTKDIPDYVGQNIFKVNPQIVERLKNSGHLLGYKDIEHSYPHCWRSKTPLIFRATPQWFLGLDLEGKELRPKAMQEVSKVKFYPEWGEARFRAMMEGRPDWCLSRQRVWGVPIPVFYCIKTGEALLDLKVINKIAETIEKEGGIDAYFAHPPEFFIGEFKAKGDFGSQGFRHSKDIFDVWFDSGVCHAAVQRKREGLQFPADVYLEGSDQHRGWFNTSFVSSLATNGVAPYKALITHGFVNDSQGMKMSKSKGNVVDPQEVSSKSGSEIIRLWTIYEDYGGDVKCGKTEFDRVTETYRRIRNSMRYLLGSIHDFESADGEVKYENLTALDKWALARLNRLLEKVNAAYDEYAFYKVYHLLNGFFTVEMSATYFDILKDRLYTWNKNGSERRGSQQTLVTITDALIRMMAPVLTFLAEESYSYFKFRKAESPLLLDFPKPNPLWNNVEIESEFERLLQIRSDAQKVLEDLRAAKTIGASLEAKVEISCNEKDFALLQKYHHSDPFKSSLREIFIVSTVELKKGEYGVTATKASGEKCQRCWIYSEDTGKDSRYPGACSKCAKALEG